MENVERRRLIIIASAVVFLALAGALSVAAWRSYSFSQTGTSEEQAQSNQVSLDFVGDTDQKTVSSTLNGWPVSLEVPSMWKTEVDYTSFFNYETRQKEASNIVSIVHPSRKVSIILQHYPFFSADGTCGPTTLQYLNKEDVPDNRLVFVEAVGEGSFFLSPTTKEAAAVFTDDFDSCFNYRNLINHDGLSIVFPLKESLPYYKKPFVSVSIRPAFVTEDKSSWSDQMVIDFLKTKEYLEAKEVVKTLRI